MADRDAAFRTEVERLHAFFEDWFCGRETGGVGVFASSLDPAFVIVGPGGSVSSRDQTVEMVDRGHDSGEVQIWIERAKVVIDGVVTIGTYEEHQKRGDERTVRASTVAMRHVEGRWLWLAVHETWLTSSH